MKISLFETNGLPLGKRNLKDPRLDLADQLVEAKKKTYAQVELVGPAETAHADAILVSEEHRADLILKDLEFIETRLGRTPPETEQAALHKLKGHLENEQFVGTASLSPEEQQALAVHNFHTNRPVIVATAAELENPDPLVLRAVEEAGYISFLTVGGKENRAWLIRRGTTAAEAAGTIHTDMQKGFIRAEIISFDDFTQAGGETGAKRAGKLRLETRSYLMQDCDVTSFRFNK